jgi:hypothetical protein
MRTHTGARHNTGSALQGCPLQVVFDGSLLAS